MLALMCAKNRVFVFDSFLDIRKKCRVAPFLDPPVGRVEKTAVLSPAPKLLSVLQTGVVLEKSGFETPTRRPRHF